MSGTSPEREARRWPRQPLGYPEDGTASARIAGDLCLAGALAAPRDKAQRGAMPAAADGQFGRTEAVLGLPAEVLLDLSVFEGVEADDGEAPGAPLLTIGRWSKAEQTVGLREDCIKAVEFTIDADPERKKDSGGGVDSV